MNVLILPSAANLLKLSTQSTSTSQASQALEDNNSTSTTSICQPATGQPTTQMSLLPSIATGLVGVLHVYIMVLEMFLWTTPRGRKAFGLKPDFAVQTKALAANQGLYNGFLAAGLFWGLVHPVPEFATQIRLFFLACVGVAGVFGAATASPRILFVQTVPACLAALAVLFG